MGAWLRYGGTWCTVGLALVGLDPTPDRFACFPEGARATACAFRQAVDAADWDSALTLCTPDLQRALEEFPSPVAFFETVFPTTAFLAAESFPRDGGEARCAHLRTAGDLCRGPTCDRIFARWKTHVRVEGLAWPWALDELEGAWRVHFYPVPLKEWTELARLKRDDIDAWYKRKQAALAPKLANVRTKLSAESKEVTLGQPMMLRLEVVNGGEHMLLYNDHHVRLGTLTVTGPDGAPVAYTFGPASTPAWYKALPPGSSAVLFDDYDVSAYYAIDLPGTYSIQFTGPQLHVGQEEYGERPPVSDRIVISTERRLPSNKVKITVAAAK